MQKSKLNLFALIVLVCIVFASIGCETLPAKKSSAIGLKAAKDVLIATARPAKQLCISGVIETEDCDKIRTAYTQGTELLLEAKSLWDLMVLADDFRANEDYGDMILKIADLTGVIESIVIKYTTESEGD